MVDDRGDAYPPACRDLSAVSSIVSSLIEVVRLIFLVARELRPVQYTVAPVSPKATPFLGRPPGRTRHNSDFFTHIRWSVGRGHGLPPMFASIRDRPILD